MKMIVLGALAACLLLVAGCMTSAPAEVQKGAGLSPTSGLSGAGSLFRAPGTSEPALLTNGSYSLTVSIDRIETGLLKPGQHWIDIYIKVENTGSPAVLPVWYSRITDTRGISHGGVGVSHGGTGAEGPLLYQGSSVIARDYITIGSDADYAVLAQGGTLDIVLVGYQPDLTPAVTFRSVWNLEPGSIR